MTLPSDVKWRVCDRCNLGHAVGEACERKARPTGTYLAARKAAKPERYVPPESEAS